MRVISAKEAVSFIKDGDSVMIGGFLGCGSAHNCVDELLAQGTQNLTLIGNDTAMADFSYGKLIVSRQVSKVIATHIGTNKETGRLMSEGVLSVTLVPQGTLAEKIRAGGYGLGGVLVSTGLGTEVAKDKEIIKVNGKEFLLEVPLRANVALIYATKADKYGNLAFDGTTRNFNPIMAMAADLVICEVEEMVDVLDANHIEVPSVVVDYIVNGGVK